MADLAWTPHPSGRMFEARFTSPRLWSMGVRRAQVWQDDTGHWWAEALTRAGWRVILDGVEVAP